MMMEEGGSKDLIKAETNDTKAQPSLLFSSRLMLAIMGCMGTFNVYSLRVNLSAAIVAMVNYTAVQEMTANSYRVSTNGTNLTVSESCPHLAHQDLWQNTSSSNNSYDDGEFIWGAADQGRVLASYFYGYVVTQIPGAWLGRRFSRVRVWGFCLLSASITTMMTPLAASYGGVPGIMAVRILIGLFSGVSYPLMHGLWGNWGPPLERSLLTSIHFAGAPLSSILIQPLAGLLSTACGWESVFYVTGAIGMTWSISWLILMHDTPAAHPRISKTEQKYIEESLACLKEKTIGHKSAIPWGKMLTSPAFLCIAFAQFSSNFGAYILLTMLPTYLYVILHFSVKESAELSAIPYLLQFILFFSSGWIVDWIIRKGVKTIYIRKITGVVSLLVPGIGILVVSYLNCDVVSTIVFFTLVVGLDALTVPGFKVCLIDIAPSLCGVMFAIGNTLSSAAGFLAPLIVAWFREINQEVEINGWRSAFGLATGVYCASALGFLLFGSSNIQPWAEENQDGRNSEEEKGSKTV